VREVHHRIKNNLQGVVGLLAEHRRTLAPALAAVLNSAISQLARGGRGAQPAGAPE